MHNGNCSYEERIEAINDDEQIRPELIESTNKKHKSNSYDAPDDYSLLYWFTQGLKLPEPKVPKRYIDSNDYLLNHLHKFNVRDQLNEGKRNRINDKYDNDQHKESRELHKKKFFISG